MSPRTESFDPIERAAEKQVARESDQHALQSGEIGRKQLIRDNSFLDSSFAAPRFDLASCAM